MKRLSGKWETVSGYTPKGGVRGDEIRSFVDIQGRTVRLCVSDFSDRWSWSVSIDDKIVAANHGFGETSKSKAKKLAEQRTRALI